MYFLFETNMFHIFALKKGKIIKTLLERLVVAAVTHSRVVTVSSAHSVGLSSLSCRVGLVGRVLGGGEVGKSGLLLSGKVLGVGLRLESHVRLGTKSFFFLLLEFNLESVCEEMVTWLACCCWAV